MQTERQQRSYGNSSIAPVARVVRVVRVVLVAERISSDGNDSSDHMETIRSLLSFASFVSLKNLPATGTTGTIIWKPGFTGQTQITMNENNKKHGQKANKTCLCITCLSKVIADELSEKCSAIRRNFMPQLRLITSRSFATCLN